MFKKSLFLLDKINTHIALFKKYTIKRFSEKSIVVFTNSAVSYYTSIYMTKIVWSHLLALRAWTLKKARKPEPRLQKSACKANS